MARAIARIVDDDQQPAQSTDLSQAGPRAQKAKPVAQIIEPMDTGPGVTDIQISAPETPGGVPKISAPMPAYEQPTFGQKLTGLGEIGLQMATGALAQPVAGMAGLAKTITSGPQQGAETIKGIEQAMTYEPRTQAAKEGMANVAAGIAPVAAPIMKGMEKTAELGADIGGPAVGAAIATLPTAIAEIWGLKGTRALRKNMMKRLFKQADMADIIDESTGMLHQGIDEALQQTDMGIDDIMDVLPQALKEQAEQVGKTVAARGGRQGKVGKVAKLVEQASPDPEIMRAAQEFGVLDDMLTSHMTKNPTHAAIVQGLMSMPGSKLAAQQQRLLERVALRADELIGRFGGMTDKAAVSDKFRAQARQVVDDLEKAAELQFGNVKGKIIEAAGTQKVPIEAPNVLRMIENEAAGLPSEAEMKPVYKWLKKKLSPRAATAETEAYQPTYQLLDQIRQEVGAGYKAKGMKIFSSAEKAELDKIYGAIAADQSLAAEKYGMDKALRAANQTIVTRKAIEDKLINAMGKDLTGNIATKARLAITNLGKGDTKAWDQLSEMIPRELGKETRKEIFATALNDVFLGQSRKKRLNPAAFDDFMNGLTRSPTAAKRLAKEIGEDNFKRLSSFHKLIGGIRRGMEKSIYTGRSLAVPGLIDDVQTMAERLFGVVEKAGKRTPGLKTVFGAGLDVGPKVPRSFTADELLASPRFRNIVIQKSMGKLNTPERMARADKLLEKDKAYQKWVQTLEPVELSDLAKVGAVGYLMGQTVEDNENEVQP